MGNLKSKRAGKAPVKTGADLSRRESQIIVLIAQGLTNKQIAVLLSLSPETVKTHVGRILKKLGASNRAQAVANATGRFPALPGGGQPAPPVIYGEDHSAFGLPGPALASDLGRVFLPSRADKRL